MAINCGALSETLLESELFGHERGAFTGAARARRGRLEMANNGTLFLDEVGEISTKMQIALLRVLEEKKFERLGGSQTIETNFRLISATHQDLPQLIKQNQFREDFFSDCRECGDHHQRGRRVDRTRRTSFNSRQASRATGAVAFE